MEGNMTSRQIKKFAAGIIDQKLGLRVSSTDLTLVDAEEYTGDGGQDLLRAVDFYRNGFPFIRYSATFRYHEWKLLITDTRTDKELLIP